MDWGFLDSGERKREKGLDGALLGYLSLLYWGTGLSRYLGLLIRVLVGLPVAILVSTPLLAFYWPPYNLAIHSSLPYAFTA